MADIYDKAERSSIMSKIGGKDTKIEVKVRRYLHRLGYRFRKNDKRYQGRPDIVLPKYDVIIFIHGCFWHGHPECKKATLPKSNVEFWKKKIKRNIERDHANYKALEKDWRIFILWKCQLMKKASFMSEMEKLVDKINAQNTA